MAKTKISKKHPAYSEKLAKLDLDNVPGLSRSYPMKELTDPQMTALAILECLQNNDPDGVMEIIAIYLEAVNKSKLKEEADLPRSTLYSTLKHKNPTIKTLAKIMYAYTH